MVKSALLPKNFSVIARPGSEVATVFDVISGAAVAFVFEMRFSRGAGRCGAGTLVGLGSLLVDGAALSSLV
jgi:hypothetical protein